ncbi:MAG: hypothetical protein AB1668_02410 [Nanoarchaeota archaeon]
MGKNAALAVSLAPLLLLVSLQTRFFYRRAGGFSSLQSNVSARLTIWPGRRRFCFFQDEAFIGNKFKKRVKKK